MKNLASLSEKLRSKKGEKQPFLNSFSPVWLAIRSQKDKEEIVEVATLWLQGDPDIRCVCPTRSLLYYDEDVQKMLSKGETPKPNLSAFRYFLRRLDEYLQQT